MEFFLALTASGFPEHKALSSSCTFLTLLEKSLGGEESVDSMLGGQESGPDVLADAFGMLNGGGLFNWLRIMAIEMGSAINNNQLTLSFCFKLIVSTFEQQIYFTPCILLAC